MHFILEFLGMAKEISLVGALLQLPLQPQRQGPQDGGKDATKKTWIHHQNGQIHAILAPKLVLNIHGTMLQWFYSS